MIYYCTICTPRKEAMLICDVELSKSTDVGLLRQHGFTVRDVSIERSFYGNFFLHCFNEFTQQEIFLGEIKSSLAAAIAMNNWLEFLHKDSFMAIYIDDYEVVIIDHYYPVGCHQ